jgi:putative peptide zinc metalloprotease protein
MLIAGVSTVLFNANPLLRFDGYYMLADIIEIPNLRQRSAQYLGSLMERRLFGVKVAAPDTSARERAWLAFFFFASFVYRVFIILAIALFIAGKYFLIGVALAIWAIVAAVVLPVARLIGYLAAHPRLRRRRLRAALSTGAVAALVLAIVFLLPFPLWTNAQGVVAVPERSVVRAGADGFVKRLIAKPGSRVREGEPLAELTDPMLPLQVRALEARRDELEARYQEEYVKSKVRALVALEELKAAEAALERARERAAELTVRSPTDGVFVVPTPQDMPDRFVKHGEQIGYVVPDAVMTASVVVPQQAADLVRGRTQRVEVKLSERIPDTWPARIKREVPAASDRLPSAALSQAGGGEVALDPQPGREVRALQTHFEFEIELPTASTAGLGGRVYVRFEHGMEPLAEQVYRTVRQLFLQRLAV